MTPLELFFGRLIYYANAAIVGATVAFIVLILVRVALNYADVNPFSRPVHRLRGMTDPFLTPVRRGLMGFGFKPTMAPLVTILIAVLVAWLATKLVTDVLGTIGGALYAARLGRLVAVVGTLLYGFLSVYSLLIFARIIFSWGMVSQRNRVMRFLVNATEPLLGPLRRIIPPLGMMDISPVVAFLIIWLFQKAIAETLMSF
ncbi:MAG TPA: YggT family protein [Pyrinomonadaceae bacterium]|jgi:YggT family protein